MKLTIAAMAMVAGCHAVPASAQQRCEETEIVYQLLYEKYGEQRVSVGVINDGAALEFWAGIESDTWTAFITRDGYSCAVASGVGWATKEPAEGDPA